MYQSISAFLIVPARILYQVMVSLLRALSAGPKKRHESGLDLCYVSEDPILIAISRPVTSLPHTLFCNPLHQIAEFISTNHPLPSITRIYNLRGELPGYHDHDFTLSTAGCIDTIHHAPWPDHHPPPLTLLFATIDDLHNFLNSGTNNVVVVHCKAGKGRTGTVLTSYLIGYRGYTYDDALRTFTIARMKPGMGEGVSIYSQRRYVKYIAMAVTQGALPPPQISSQSTAPPSSSSSSSSSSSLPGQLTPSQLPMDRKVRVKAIRVLGMGKGNLRLTVAGYQFDAHDPRGGWIIKHVWRGYSQSIEHQQSPADGKELTSEIIFYPNTIVSTSDICVQVQQTLLGSIISRARTWFNALWEDPSGAFQVPWEEMDGMKGTNLKGIKSFERMIVEWEFVEGDEGEGRMTGYGTLTTDDSVRL